MKNDAKRDTLVGGLVFFFFAVLLMVSYGGKQMASKASVGTYPIRAVFSRVDGLFKGDEVRLGGIRMGTVGQQLLDKNFRAVVTLNMNDGLKIPVDSAAAIHTDGLLGSKFVVIDPGGAEKMLAAGDEIEYTQGSVVVSELLSLIIDEGKAKKAKQNTQQGRN